MRTTVFAAMAALGLALPAAAADLIAKPSPHSVADTAARFVAAVEGAGAKVFAQVDHAAGAASIDAELRPTVMILFGNPNIGTPVMQADQAAGIDLPLRMLVWEDAEGQVSIGYLPPTELAARYDVPEDLKALQMMAGALDKLTSAAVAE